MPIRRQKDRAAAQSPKALRGGAVLVRIGRTDDYSSAKYLMVRTIWLV